MYGKDSAIGELVAKVQLASICISCGKLWLEKLIHGFNIFFKLLFCGSKAEP
jgi:hypothetical protein